MTVEHRRPPDCPPERRTPKWSCTERWWCTRLRWRVGVVTVGARRPAGDPRLERGRAGHRARCPAVAVAEALTTPHRVPTVVNEVIGGEAAEALLVESGQGAGTSETGAAGGF